MRNNIRQKGKDYPNTSPRQGPAIPDTSLSSHSLQGKGPAVVGPGAVLGQRQRRASGRDSLNLGNRIPARGEPAISRSASSLTFTNGEDLDNAQRLVPVKPKNLDKGKEKEKEFKLRKDGYQSCSVNGASIAGTDSTAYFSEDEKGFYDRYFAQSVTETKTFAPTEGLLPSLQEIALKQVREQVKEIFKQLLCAFACKNAEGVRSNFESLMALYKDLDMYEKSEEEYIEKLVDAVLSEVPSKLWDELYSQLLSLDPSICDKTIALDLSLVLEKTRQCLYLSACKRFFEFFRYQELTDCSYVWRFDDTGKHICDVSMELYDVVCVLKRGVVAQSDLTYLQKHILEQVSLLEEHDYVVERACFYYFTWLLNGVPNSVLSVLLDLESAKPDSPALSVMGEAIRRMYHGRFLSSSKFNTKDALRTGHVGMQILPLLNERHIGILTLKNIYAQYECVSIWMQRIDEVGKLEKVEKKSSKRKLRQSELNSVADQFAIAVTKRFQSVSVDRILNEIDVASLSDLHFLRKFALKFWPDLVPHVSKAIGEYKNSQQLEMLLNNEAALRQQAARLPSNQLLELLKIVETYKDRPGYPRLRGYVVNAIIDKVEQEMESVLLQLLDYVRHTQPLIESSRYHRSRFLGCDIEYAVEAVVGFLSDRMKLLVYSGLVPERLSDQVYWDRTQESKCSFGLAGGVEPQLYNRTPTHRMLSNFYKAIIAHSQEKGVLQDHEVMCLNGWGWRLYALFSANPLTPEEQKVFQIETMRRKVAELTVPRLVTDDDQL